MKLPAKMTKTITSLTLLGALALTGCSATKQASTLENNTVTVAGASSSASSSVSATSTAGNISYDTHYDADDLTWDEASVIDINLSDPASAQGISLDNGTLTISAAGTYRLSGSYSGQVKVAAGAEDTVRLVLDNAQIKNEQGTALYSESSNETLVYTLAGTVNTLEDGSQYAATGTEDPTAALDAKTDLTLAGEGLLKVTGNYADGISTGDGLTIVSGSYEVTATDDGIRGKDYVDIQGGTITVKAAQDGIKSTNDTDAERGWSRISGGDITISAGDDGFKSERELEISGGSLDISQSVEGVEGQHLFLTGGTITVTSSDDAINATVPTSSTTASSSSGSRMGGGMNQVVDASITIDGAEVTLNAGGDGFDSNGTATIKSGSLTINGPFTGGNGSFDVNGSYSIEGGTVIAGGTADMYLAPGSTTQGYIAVSASGLAEGDLVELKDADGTVLASYTVVSSKTQALTFSTENLVSGQSYTLDLAGNQKTVTAQ